MISETNSRDGGRRAFLFLVAAATVLLGFRLLLIRDHGFAHPWWDQWYAEGELLIAPWVEGRFGVADLFSASSEHRLVFTRLTQLALLVADGQWDPLTQAVANAIIFTLGATALFWSVSGVNAPASRPLCFGLFALFCTSIGWPNTLWGFQSQFYFLMFFSLLALAIVATVPPLSRHWWGAPALAFFSFLGMAGGVITPIACGALQLLRAIHERRFGRALWLALAVWLLLAVALYAWVPAIPGSAVQAHTLTEFLSAFLQNLAFPHLTAIHAMPTMTIVAIALAVVFIAAPSARWTPGDWMTLGAAIWVIGQSVAIAYSRGAGGAAPVHRYHEVLGILAISASALLWRLPRVLSFSGLPLLVSTLIAVGFAVWTAQGMYIWQRQALDFWLPQRDAEFVVHEQNLRYIVRTGDDERLVSLTPAQIGSYLPAAHLAALLNLPSLRRVLPSSIRHPVTAVGAPAAAEIGEPITLASLERLTGLPSRVVVVAFETATNVSLVDIARGLSVGAVLVPGPYVGAIRRVSVATSTSNLRAGTVLHDLMLKLQADHLTLPRAIGPLAIVARLLLSLAGLIVNLGLVMVTATVIAGLWRRRRAVAAST